MQSTSQIQNTLSYGTFKTKKLLAIGSSNGLQTLALTDVHSHSDCLEVMRLSSQFKTRSVLATDFRNGAQTQFILIAKNGFGYKNINNYLSKFSHDSELIIPEIAPQLKDVFVIYPYRHKKTYQLKENEFLGIEPKDLNHLKFSKWNSVRNKLVVLETVSFQMKKECNTHKLLRAVYNNTVLNKLAKTEETQINNKMLPFQELSNIYDEFPKFIKNTFSILEERPVNLDLAHKQLDHKECGANMEILGLQLLKKKTYDGLNYHYKKLEERVLTTNEKELSVI